MNAFEFMILENMGMTTTTLGRKNEMFFTLDEIKQKGRIIDVDLISRILMESNLTSADLTAEDQLRLNDYLTN